MYNINIYEKIIKIICDMKGIKRKEICKIMKDKEYKYLIFFLFKKYKCDDLDKINRDFSINNIRSIRYNEKKGEEKFFINKGFREIYFEIQGKLDKVN